MGARDYMSRFSSISDLAPQLSTQISNALISRIALLGCTARRRRFAAGCTPDGCHVSVQATSLLLMCSGQLSLRMASGLPRHKITRPKARTTRSVGRDRSTSIASALRLKSSIKLCIPAFLTSNSNDCDPLTLEVLTHPFQ